MMEEVLAVALRIRAAQKERGDDLVRVDVDAHHRRGGRGDLAEGFHRQLLASALSNLLQNAFKYSKLEGSVSLVTRATKDRVAIDVSDACGGLPPGKVEELFRPFTRGSSDRTGLGLGLSIALSATRANSGELYVRNMPGEGCIFTIDLPRHPAPSPSLFRVLPDGEHGLFQGADPAIEGRPHSGDTKSRVG